MPRNSSLIPQAPPRATVTLLLGLITTFMLAKGATSSDLAKSVAIGVGLSFAISLLVDYRQNIRNLARADIMALSSLYFLTLAEFCVPQPAIDPIVTPDELLPALGACILGFGAFAIGRHFRLPTPRNIGHFTRFEPPNKVILGLYALCFTGGYAYMLFSVDFDVNRMIDAFMAPRFMQPWGRGRFGDWRALLTELGMVLYLVPPIAGVILAERKKYTNFQVLLVALGLAFTLFYGYTSGTRNIFATYLATALVAYAFAAGKERRREVFFIAAIAGGAMLYATTTMLEFRNIGFKNYMAGVSEFGPEEKEKTFFVDNNLLVIARLIQVFPDEHNYLGLEIPYLALVRPIPRALWRTKPEGMSLSIEQALHTDDSYTLAASFVGEAYMSGGYVGVFFFGLFLGMIMGWWNEFGREDNSAFGYLIYASGFFAAVISMRSLLIFTTAILPTVAATVFAQWAIRSGYRKLRHREVPPA